MDSLSPASMDALKLVNTFAERENFGFQEFQKEWTASKFYYLHCVAKDLNAKIVVLEVMFASMVSIIADEEYRLVERVGALYLCYSLYFTQPSPNLVKIRVSTDDWRKLQALHDQLRSKKLYDADFIFCQLKSFSVFLICAFRKKLCLGQEGELVSTELLALGDQQSVSPESELMINLTKTQELLHEYNTLKESISDHLPDHVLTKSTEIDDLLSTSRLKILRMASDEKLDRSESSQEDDKEISDESESRWREILRKAYKDAPKCINKVGRKRSHQQ